MNKKQNAAAYFLTAQTISLLGSSLVQYAIIWYITLLTSSGKMLAVSTLCGFLPQIVVSLFFGAYLDKYDRKKIIMVSDAAIALATLILAIMLYNGYESMTLVFFVLMVRSAGTGIQAPAVSAVLPQITPPEKLMKINGIHQSITAFTMFVSPALSAATLGTFGLEATLLIDVITAIIGIFITSKTNIPLLEKKTGSFSVISEIKEGFKYVKETGFIRRILIFQIVVLFLISPSAFLTPLMVSRTFGQELWRLSSSEMAYSIGSIVGGLFIAAHGGFKNKMTTTLFAGFSYGVLMICLGVSPFFAAYIIANLLIGITSPCYSTPLNVLISQNVEPSMHGRIFSLMHIASSCALPLGMTLFGPLADRIMIQNLFIFNGFAVIAVTAFLLYRTKVAN